MACFDYRCFHQDTPTTGVTGWKEILTCSDSAIMESITTYIRTIGIFDIIFCSSCLMHPKRKGGFLHDVSKDFTTITLFGPCCFCPQIFSMIGHRVSYSARAKAPLKKLPYSCLHAPRPFSLLRVSEFVHFIWIVFPALSKFCDNTTY